MLLCCPRRERLLWMDAVRDHLTVSMFKHSSRDFLTHCLVRYAYAMQIIASAKPGVNSSSARDILSATEDSQVPRWPKYQRSLV